MPPEPDPKAEMPIVTGMDGKPLGALFSEPENRAADNIPGPRSSWMQIIKRAKLAAILAVLGLIIISTGGIFFAYRWYSRKSTSLKPSPLPISTDLKSLPGATLGRQGETLTVGAETNFKGRVAVAGDVDIAGKLNTGTALNVSSLQVSGITTLSAAEVKSNLSVSGTSALQGPVTVGNLLSVAGNLNVSGNSSFGGSLTAGNLSVRNQTVAGTLTLAGHVISGGPLLSAGAGSAVGGAGTVSISGNDRSGTITINTGGGPPAGILVNVSFRSPYSGTPHVLVSPIGSNSGALQFYVTKSAQGFSIATLNAPAAGATYSFDYLVEQ